MHSPRGNALFLILIAVALFAALSYAITQSGRGGGTISKEQALISSAQITQFPAGIRTVVNRMIITGTAIDDIDFDTAATGAGAVFDSAAGGGATYINPPNNIGNAYGGPLGATASTWGFKDIKDATLGYYIKDIGTNTDVTGRDAFAYLHGISQAVCEQINKGLGLAPQPTETYAVNFGMGAGKGAATYNDGSNVFDGSAAGFLNPAPAFACVWTDRSGAGDEFDYYHALIEQ